MKRTFGNLFEIRGYTYGTVVDIVGYNYCVYLKKTEIKNIIERKLFTIYSHGI